MKWSVACGLASATVAACLLGAPEVAAQSNTSGKSNTAAQPPPAAPAAAPQAPAAGEAGADKEKAKEPKPSVTGGYTWTDKKPRRRRRWARRKFDPNAPIATYPGFLMLPDGSSQVWVYVNKKVPVVVSAAAGRVTYILTGASIAVYNNTRTLRTEYFDTPLRSARLRRDKNGAQLILNMREATGTPSHKVESGPGGIMVLRIQLPKAKKRYSDAPFRRLPRGVRRK